jgi:hypothetical protein
MHCFNARDSSLRPLMFPGRQEYSHESCLYGIYESGIWGGGGLNKLLLSWCTSDFVTLSIGLLA